MTVTTRVLVVGGETPVPEAIIPLVDEWEASGANGVTVDRIPAEALDTSGSLDDPAGADPAMGDDSILGDEATPAVVIVTDREGRSAVAGRSGTVPVIGVGVDPDDVVDVRIDDPERLRSVVSGVALTAKGSNTETGSESGSDTGSGSGPEPGSGSGPEPGSGSGSEPGSGSGSDSLAEDDPTDGSFTRGDMASSPRSRLERLHVGTATLVTATDVETVYSSVALIARDLLGFDFCYLGIADGDGFRPVEAKHAWQKRFDLEFGLVGETYRTGEPCIVDDVREDPRWESDWDRLRSAVSLPLGDRGVFQVGSDEPHDFDEEDLELLSLLLSYAENTLARIESEEELRENRRRVTDLHGGVSEFAGIRTSDELYEKTVEIADRVLSLDRCSVFHSDGAYLSVAAQSASSDPDDVRDRIPHDHDSLAGLTIREGESHLVRELEAAENADPAREEYRSGISVPIGDHGVFQAVSTESRAFDEVDLELVELLATHAAESLTRIAVDERLREERDRLSALFENIPDAAVAYEYVDGEPIVRQVNDAFEEVFGWEPGTVLDESIDDFILPEDGDAIEDAAHLNEQLRCGNNVREEVFRMTATGPRHFLIHVVPVRLDAENISGYAIYTDVTERQEREQQLRRQNEQLDDFASIVSHDLRNPLSVAMGYLELAADSGDPEDFDRVRNALSRMEDLVGDLLSLARQGEVVGETQTVRLGSLAEQAWGNVSTGDAELVIDGDRQLDVDPDRTVELFENLFRNAIEHGYSEAGGGAMSVDTGDEARGSVGTSADTDGTPVDTPPGDGTAAAPTVRVGSVTYRSDGAEGFFVEDDGRGIPPAEREKVFETGYSTDEAGTGLGLAITHHIAVAHDWNVRVLGGRDGGARFEFQFEEQAQ